MPDPITIEDIYKLFQRSQEEADRRFAEADRRAAEADRRAVEAATRFERELAESRAEFDRRMAETNAEAATRFEQELAESRAEFDRRMAETNAEAATRFEQELAESRAEFDRRMNQTKAENDRAIQAMQKTVDALTSRWGRFVENLVAPAVLRLFQERGFNVQEVYQRVRSARGSRHLEIDVLVVDDDVAIVVEVKSRLTQNEIRQVLNTLNQFKTAFPHYANYQIYGAVAAIEIDKDVDTYAYNQGLFVIVQSGDSVMISNTLDFRPRTW
jgi:hypothetical protein